MKIITAVDVLKEEVLKLKKQNLKIGFVPTMGYLHQGHLSLVDAAKKENDVVIVSIYVNPIQFLQGEDLSVYPRDIERDQTLLIEKCVDILFLPTDEMMYPTGFNTYVDVLGVTEGLCSGTRPGHFKGVSTVCNKLFNITVADNAYFGQKDAQQLAVIKKMVKDLDMNIKIIACPIVREQDGLALSSRNVYLSGEERKDATVLYRALCLAQQSIQNGNNDVYQIKKMMINEISKISYAVIDYVEIVDAKTMEKIEKLSDHVLIALAVKFGKTRLIDNIVIEV